MGPRFQDRFDAGRFLASRLMEHANRPGTVVLALPRGGVPVGFEVARELNLPLDIFVVRKLGFPGREELAFGAIASGGVRVLNEEMARRYELPLETIEAITRAEQQELERRERLWRGKREPIAIEGQRVILVDDGLATGASMRAAVRSLHERSPAGITVAVPIGSRDTCGQFRSEADEVVCGEMPEPFYAVGTWYSNFLQVTDEEVQQLLDRARQLRRAGELRNPSGALGTR